MSVVRIYYSQLLPKDISYFASHVDEIHLHVVVHFVRVYVGFFFFEIKLSDHLAIILVVLEFGSSYFDQSDSQHVQLVSKETGNTPPPPIFVMFTGKNRLYSISIPTLVWIFIYFYCLLIIATEKVVSSSDCSEWNDLSKSA